MYKVTLYLLLFVISITYTTKIYAVQKAKVKSVYAVLYSDLERKSPIAKLKKNSILYVGDVARNKRTMFPTVLYGKIVYVLRSDIIIIKQMR